MASLGKHYDQSFFDNIENPSLTAAKILLPEIFKMLPCESVVDVGCGRGSFLSVAQELGVKRILGTDGDYVQREKLLIPAECFVPADLEKPLPINEKFDLAICLEVAEHLSEGRADSFVSDLVGLARAIYFSAAVPRQGGVNHINEQWQSYWQAKFDKHGYVPIDHLRRKFWHDKYAGDVYLQNGFIYCSRDLLSSNQALAGAYSKTDLDLIDITHPRLYLAKNSLEHPTELDIKRVLRAIPTAFKMSLGRWKERRNGIGGT